MALEQKSLATPLYYNIRYGYQHRKYGCRTKIVSPITSKFRLGLLVTKHSNYRKKIPSICNPIHIFVFCIWDLSLMPKPKNSVDISFFDINTFPLQRNWDLDDHYSCYIFRLQFFLYYCLCLWLYVFVCVCVFYSVCVFVSEWMCLWVGFSVEC